MKLSTFEVRIEVPAGSKSWGTYPQAPNQKGRKGVWIIPTIVKMLHIEARTHKQAALRAKAKRLGRIVSCRQLDAHAMIGNIENLKLDQVPMVGADSPYSNAVAMDEMIWAKRNKRRKNLQKDKENY